MRVQSDAQAGPVSIQHFLDELLSEDELFEKSMERMFNRLDDQIARQEARKQ
jgi:hypothetical protein